MSVDITSGPSQDDFEDIHSRLTERASPRSMLLRLLRALAVGLFVLAVPAALLTTTVRYVANESRVYRYAFDQFGAVEATGIERPELIRAGAELRAFFNNDADTLTIRVESDGEEVNLFSQRETAHLEDVKDRFRLVSRLNEFSVLYIVAFVVSAVVWSREMSLRSLAVYVAAASLLTLVLIGAIGVLGAVGFDSAWENFHQLIFSNDFWLLNPRTDRLIQMFPPDFWQSIVFFVGVMAAAEAALLLIVAAIYLGVSGRPSHRRRRLEV